MIVPGDIGAEVDRIERVFQSLVSNYDAVCYVPGNHEVSTNPNDSSPHDVDLAWRKGTRQGISATTSELRDAATNRMVPQTAFISSMRSSILLRIAEYSLDRKVQVRQSRSVGGAPTQSAPLIVGLWARTNSPRLPSRGGGCAFRPKMGRLLPLLLTGVMTDQVDRWASSNQWSREREKQLPQFTISTISRTQDPMPTITPVA